MNFQTLSQSWFIYPIMVWSLIWKGLALWRAAKNGQKYWFMALLVVNTMGILEIIYLKFFAKLRISLAKKLRGMAVKISIPTTNLIKESQR